MFLINFLHSVLALEIFTAFPELSHKRKLGQRFGGRLLSEIDKGSNVTILVSDKGTNVTVLI